jgi:hypothetical protein
MPACRLYVLNHSFRIQGSEIIEAATDADAVQSANVALNGRLGELWLAAKKVRTFDLAR